MCVPPRVPYQGLHSLDIESDSGGKDHVTKVVRWVEDPENERVKGDPCSDFAGFHILPPMQFIFPIL